ncbi:MAG: hypothetical protein RLZZ04_216, partial [Cyanobacteriota bacterium]
RVCVCAVCLTGARIPGTPAGSTADGVTGHLAQPSQPPVQPPPGGPPNLEGGLQPLQ